MYEYSVRTNSKLLEHKMPFFIFDPGSVEPIETRHLVIHFHLEDETIEVAEDHDTNSGRYKAPLFLKRCKIPKVYSIYRVKYRNTNEQFSHFVIDIFT